jgi:transposase
MKKPTQHLITEIPHRHARTELTIGIDLGDVWSHYCTLNQSGEVVDRGRFRTTAKAVEKWFKDLPPTRVAMEAGVHSIWISEQLESLDHEVIVANVRALSRTVIARVIRSMPRSWPATLASIQRSYVPFRTAPSSNRKLSP